MSTLAAYAIALLIPPLAFYLIYALDLFKTSKPQTVVICALWGALVAYPLAALINGELHVLLGYALVVSLTAPLVEEILKALVLLYFTRQPSFYYFVDGAVYGFGVGIGFAVIENFAYVSASPSLSLAIMRVLSTSLMHAMASGVVGISLGRLRRTRAPLLPLLGIGMRDHRPRRLQQRRQHADRDRRCCWSPSGSASAAQALIGLQIVYGLRQEKAQFTQTLGLQIDVSPGERQAIQRLGGASIETILQRTAPDLRRGKRRADPPPADHRGEHRHSGEQPRLVQRQPALARGVGSGDRRSGRRKAATCAARWGARCWPICKICSRRTTAPCGTILQDQFAAHDPTMVHTFDMFMRLSGLAQKFSPEQLEAMARAPEPDRHLQARLAGRPGKPEPRGRGRALSTTARCCSTRATTATPCT